MAMAISIYSDKVVQPIAGILLLLNATASSVMASEQVIGAGGTGIIHSGKGDINISGYSIEQYESALRQQENRIRSDLEAVYQSKSETLALKKQLLELQLSGVQKKLSDAEENYQQHIAFLESSFVELLAVASEENSSQLAQAKILKKVQSWMKVQQSRSRASRS